MLLNHNTVVIDGISLPTPPQGQQREEQQDKFADDIRGSIGPSQLDEKQLEEERYDMVHSGTGKPSLKHGS